VSRTSSVTLDGRTTGVRRAALTVVVAHGLVLLGHDLAHRRLGVGLVLWQLGFAYLVIVAAPIVAAGLVFTRHARAGFALLAISMAGALAFGVYHHYVAVSPDHVLHLPTGDARLLFQVTAAVMALIECAGLGLALVASKRLGKAER